MGDTGETVTVGGYTFTCVSGPCSVSVSNDRVTVGGTINVAVAMTEPPPPDPAIAERAAINTAISAARTAVAAVTNTASDAVVTAADTAITNARNAITAATNVPASERTAHTATVNAIATTLSNAKASRTAAMTDKNKKDMAKLQKLAEAIGAVSTDDLDDHVRGEDLTGNALTTARTKPTTATDLDAPYKIAGWNGMSWSETSGSGATKTTTTAVVYNDKTAATSGVFNKRFASIAQTGENAGQYRLTPNDHGKLIKISGLPTHPSHDGLAVGQTNGVRGSFAGVTGTFTGNSAAISIKISATDGSPTWTGDLDFKPDSATATVSMPDTSYMNLGWWLTMNASGVISDVQVDAWGSGAAYDQENKLGALIGKATFQGIAVGKYTHKTINSISGGHFNADAELVADFGDASAQGTLTGTIDNFMSDGKSIGSGWKVELGAAATGDPTLVFDPKAGATIASGAVTDTNNGALGTFGTQTTMGTWNATFVDNTRKDKMPGGVTGTFHVGQTAHPINMVGAFAASNQEADMPDN